MIAVSLSAKTRETDITIALHPGEGQGVIDTGVGFFDHMLAALSFHGGFCLECRAAGDLHVDAHHTVEDTGILLGKALRDSLDGCRGIERFAHTYIPMDEALAFAALDISSRPFLSFDAQMSGMMGQYDAGLTQEFFRAIAFNAGLTLHMRVTGYNAHHMTEALYKAFGRVWRTASAVTGEGIRSTKGVL